MRASWPMVAIWIFGCTEGGYPPRISAIIPAEGANDLDVAVEISAENLEPRIHTDFDHSDKSSWNREYSASLVPVDSALPEIALADVHLELGSVLKGTVPSGAVRGFYGLRVVDSFGRTGFVPEVYRVVASAKRVAAFRFDPIGSQHPGVPFTVQVSAVDAEGNVVDGFASGVDVADDTRTLSPVRIEPFALGRARAQVTVGAFNSANRLMVTDAEGRQGSSNAFAVLPGLVVELAFVSAAQSLVVGQCSGKVELEARDTFGFPVKLEAAVESDLSAAPPEGVAFFSDPACAQAISSLSLPAGQSRQSFYFHSSVSGSFVLRVVPEVLPSASQLQMVTQ
jgi:hypothetical protein